ncbi:MAG: hemolysin III family protein [Pseudomonadota bacterium]
MVRGERFNSISHLVAAAMALAGASVLITIAAINGDPTRLVSVSIYGASVFLLFLFSTLYHSLVGKAKRIFKKLDHLAIYLMIAGTYTPFALVAIQGSIGWWLFGAIWGMAAAGVAVEFLPLKGPRIIPIALYLAMGWACLFTFDAIVAGLPASGLYWLIAGGVIYTIGVVFYVLDHWVPWCHEIWHLFVIAGGICHFVAITLI